MAFILSQYSSVLKEVILPYIQDNLPTQKTTLNQFSKSVDHEVINNNFHVPLRVTRHGGITSLANDGNNFTQTDGATFSRGSVPSRDHVGAFRISDKVMKASEGNTLAIKSAFMAQADSLMKDFGRDMNRQLYGANINIIGQVSGSVSSGEITVKAIDTATIDDGRALDYYGTVNGDIAPAQFLVGGQRILIGSGGAVGTVGTVTNNGKGVAVGTVLLSGTAASAANDAIYLLDSSLGGTAAMNGIRDALSSLTGTNQYAGIARSTEGWTPQFGSASEALSLDEMEIRFLNAVDFGQPNDRYVCFMNNTLYKKFGQLMTAMRRTVNKTELVGGWSGLSFDVGEGMVGVFRDNLVPDGEVAILNLDTWSLCELEPMGWADNGDLLRISNTLTYETALVWYANVFCRAPAANARLANKTD